MLGARIGLEPLAKLILGAGVQWLSEPTSPSTAKPLPPDDLWEAVESLLPDPPKRRPASHSGSGARPESFREEKRRSVGDVPRKWAAAAK